MLNRPNHFEIHATDPEAAASFYTAVFGWEIKKWESPDMEYWMVMTGPQGPGDGINGGLVRRKGPAPTEGQAVFGYVVTVTVDSFDEIAARVAANGGTVALPKFNIAGMAWQGYFKDNDGNIFGVHEPIKKA